MQAQGDIRVDPLAIQLIGRGKAYLETGNYTLALEAFTEAKDRPFHQASTAAMYYVGLTHYRNRRDALAQQAFDALIAEYPRSRYVPEARYHRALIFLRDPSGRQERVAIDDLFDLLAQTPLSALHDDVRLLLRQYFFYQAAEGTLRQYLRRYDPVGEPMLIEAWCYRQVQRGNKAAAADAYRKYRSEGGASLPFIERLLGQDQQVQYYLPGVARVALVLPLFLPEGDFEPADTLLPPQSRIAVEFYEGFMLAVEAHSVLSQRRYLVEVFDTRRDSATLQAITGQLDSLQPDLVVGEIYNRESEQLAQWAERRGVTQVVPLSPAGELVEGRNYVFLAHPTIEAHGASLATYAWDSLRLNRVAVWTDGTHDTEQLAKAFAETFDTLGGEIIPLQVDSVYKDAAQKQVRDLVYSLKFQRVDGVYIPITDNQETAGLILSQMRLLDIAARVMGSPSWWQRYSRIDRNLKNSYELIFTTGNMHERTDAEYENFFQAYLRDYHLPPSTYSLQGYDVGMYLLRVLDDYDPRSGQSLAAFLRNYPVYTGIHLAFDFGGKQYNRFVNIGAYRDGRIEKINHGGSVSLSDIFPTRD
ncbi:MAG: ABC transporter substrate-binding protein [Bacteroidia bacterium]